MNRFFTTITSVLSLAVLAAAGGCVGWRTNPLAPSHMQLPPYAPAAFPAAAGPAPASAPQTTFASRNPGVIRGQNQNRALFAQPISNPRAPSNAQTPGSPDHWRFPVAPSGQPVARGQDGGQPLQTVEGQEVFGPAFPGFAPSGGVVQPVPQFDPNAPPLDFDVYVEETRTGRFMFGMGVNSDLGVTGQIVVEERNFDWRRFPTSFQDIVNGTAWRGAGQGFRLEAMPGSQVQRYLASFTQPYLYLPGFAEPFSLNLSGFFFDRRYFDWDEQRLGGRIGLGYRLTHDLSFTTSVRAENVNIHDLRVVGLIPELDEVAGDNSLFSGRFTLTHDTRDVPFAPTQGHLIELSYEQVFGSFDYPRGEFDFRQYFLMRERPDGSGRHTLGFSFRGGFSGAQTPIFERYFAGGFSTLRGFDFRGASPVGPAGVVLGGDFRFLGSVEYLFPLTADDMMRGVVFCDYGTVEEEITINSDNYRVAPGIGLRIMVPALGPAPLALDFAFPVAKARFDDTQVFSFFFGFGR